MRTGTGKGQGTRMRSTVLGWLSVALPATALPSYAATRLVDASLIITGTRDVDVEFMDGSLTRLFYPRDTGGAAPVDSNLGPMWPEAVSVCLPQRRNFE